MPAILIDIGLAFSIALSVLILMVALWIQRPLDFSAFPTVLLIATMLRLSLNIATTRLILSHGAEGYTAAGHVIAGFANFVMSGDFVIGIIVFIILITVNFIVITKGATRIAEVGARFTLDAIPGKQMAIDADLSAGMIDEKEAQRRRRELEEESAFFGSMDGASKFVRGDAIAGLIITAVNIFGGIIIGVARHDMAIARAADVFIKLSVGDGLVTQIPALIVSLAAGLLVSKGGTRGSTDKAIFGQLGDYPRALAMSGFVLVVLGLMPGLPALPFLMLGSMLAFSANLVVRRREDGTPKRRHRPQKPSGAPTRKPQLRQGIAQDGRDRALPRQADLGLAASPRTPSSRAAWHKMRKQVRPAIRLRRAGNQAHRRFRDPGEELPDQGPRHGRRKRRTAHRRVLVIVGDGPRPTCPAKRCASRPSA